MNRRKHLGLCLLAISLVSAAAAVAQEERESRQREDFGFTFSVTPTMIRNFLDTVADDMAGDYELDDEQYYQVNEILHERLPAFLAENRPALQKLATEFAEAWSANEPPDSEFVAEWAEGARLMLEKFQGTVEVMADDFRGVFNEDQIVQLDGYLAMVDVGSQLLDQRLHGWSEGSFDAETDWHRSATYMTAEIGRRQDMERTMVEARLDTIAFHTGQPRTDPQSAGAQSGAAGGSPGASSRDTPPPRGARGDGGKTAKPKDKWETYTEQFIVKFALNDSQAQRARLHYQRAAADRDRYQRRKLPELTRIATALESAKTPKDREQAQKMKSQFEQGIEHMFERLKTKLATEPTRSQKRAAADGGKID